MAKQSKRHEVLYVDPVRNLVYKLLVSFLRVLRDVHGLDKQPDGRDVTIDILRCALQDAGINNHRPPTVAKNRARKSKRS